MAYVYALISIGRWVMRCAMSSDVYDILDELAARGRRLCGQLPGDYKPVEEGAPTADALANVCALILSWPAADKIQHPLADSSR